MADSIREQIVKNVVTTLEGITEALGFDITVASVQRSRRAGPTIHEFPTILVIEESEAILPQTEGRGPLGKWTKLMSLGLVCWIENEEAGEAVNQILANVEKALMADISRGNLAVLTNLVSNQSFITEDIDNPESGVTMVIEIRYRVQERDPFSL